MFVGVNLVSVRVCVPIVVKLKRVAEGELRVEAGEKGEEPGESWIPPLGWQFSQSRASSVPRPCRWAYLMKLHTDWTDKVQRTLSPSHTHTHIFKYTETANANGSCRTGTHSSQNNVTQLPQHAQACEQTSCSDPQHCLGHFHYNTHFCLLHKQESQTFRSHKF